MNIDNDKSYKFEIQKTYKYEQEYNIPSKQELIVEYFIEQTIVEASWTSFLTIRGCVVAEFTNPLRNGEKYTMNYVHEIYRNVPYMTCGKTQGDDSCESSYCTYVIKGLFNGVQESKDDTSVKLMPLSN